MTALVYFQLQNFCSFSTLPDHHLNNDLWSHSCSSTIAPVTTICVVICSYIALLRETAVFFLTTIALSFSDIRSVQCSSLIIQLSLMPFKTTCNLWSAVQLFPCDDDNQRPTAHQRFALTWLPPTVYGVPDTLYNSYQMTELVRPPECPWLITGSCRIL